VDHIKDLISEELIFAQKMELEEAEAILMDSVSPLCNPAQSK
jgi:hypothetical protein